MIKISAKHFVYFDVDDTLIDWQKENTEYSVCFNSSIGIVSLEPKYDVIHKLKQHKKEGYAIVVGADWAEHVVKTLGLCDYVDLVIGKPNIYYDDLKCDVFMKNWIDTSHI